MRHGKKRITYQKINGKANYKQSEREYENREMIKKKQNCKGISKNGNKTRQKEEYHTQKIS
jgi:hypothetical protein